jgi:hypothetical protein
MDNLLAPARTVTAVMKFRGTAGQEQRAAEAWAFELTYYFLRGVGEPPQVTYDNGVYTCSGPMTTTHPGDCGDPVLFDSGEPASLAFCTSPERTDSLRFLYPKRGLRFDGRPVEEGRDD